MYVIANGEYTVYNPSNPTHLGETIYEKQQAEDTVYFVDKATPNVNGENYAYNEADVLYAKQYCENIYVKDATGEYTVINGKAETFVEGVHSPNARYSVVVGYLAQVNEVYTSIKDADDNITSYNNPLPHLTARVNVENEKSEAVLRMIAREQVTIENINGVIKNAKISDIMDLTEGSLFYGFKDRSLNDLSSEVEKEFATMTLGELMSYASITEIDADVKSTIAPISIKDFFRSLSPSTTAGIVINLEKAYGYKA